MALPSIERALIKVMQVVIAVIAGVTILGIHPIVRTFVRGSFDVAGGRTVCSLSQIWKGELYLRTRLESAKKIAERMLLVERDAHLVRWQTPYGSYWTPERMDASGLAIMLAERQNNLYGDQGIHRGDIVLDCGANIGVFTREALDSGARVVVAIEPAPDVVVSLQRTYSDEIRDGRVIVCGKGVWDKDDFLTLKESGDSIGDSFVVNYGPRRPSEHKIPLTTIDKLVAEFDLPRVDYIKMDIEGAERRALRGARATIRAFRPRLAIAAEHLPDDPTVIPAVVRGLWNGYAVQCGPCYRMVYHQRISPDVLFFQP